MPVVASPAGPVPRSSRNSPSWPAALLNTIAASAAVGYAAAHVAGRGSAAALATAATIHGFTVAMIWGTVILAATAIPVAISIKAPKPARGQTR